MSRTAYLTIFAILAALSLVYSEDSQPIVTSNPSVSGNIGGIQITIERIPSEPDRRHNIVSSAVRGTGRLLRTYTLEAAELASTVGKGVVKFGKNTATATGESVIDSTKRVLPASFRQKLQPSDHSKPTDSGVQSSQDDELQNNVETPSV